MARKFKRKFKKYMKNKKLATKSYVKMQLAKNIENKYQDIARIGDNIDYNGRIDRFTGVIQGQSDTTRLGDKLTIKSLHLSYYAVSTDPNQTFRLIIFQWYPNTTLAAPIAADILALTGAASAISQYYVWDILNQFNILYDKVHVLNDASTTSIHKKIKVNLKYAKKIINFTAATQEGSNHLYMLRISDVTGTNLVSSNFVSRFIFEDA